MFDVNKLTATIEELEKQTQYIKSASIFFEKLQEMKQRLAELFEKVNSQEKDVHTSLKSLEDINKGLSKFLNDGKAQIDTWGSSLVTEVNKFGDTTEKTINNLTERTKSAYQELDSSITSKLEKHKSDIVVSLRNEGDQIQRALENKLNEKLNIIEKLISTNFVSIEEKLKKQRSTQYVLMTLVVLQFAASVLVILKLLLP